MDADFIISIVFSASLVTSGLGLLVGVHRNKVKWLQISLDLDKVFFPNLNDERVIKLADQLAALVCFLISILIVFNSLIALVYPRVINVSLIFFVVGIFVLYPVRAIYFLLARGTNYDELARIWPFKKP